jgi:hypothetical protein
MQGTKLNGNSNNVASFSSQALLDTPSRQIPKTTSAIAGDAFGTEAKLQTLQYQATQTRYSLFLAQAQTGRSGGSLYVVKPKTFNDPIIGQFTSGERNVQGPFKNPLPNPAFPAPGDPAAKNDADNGKAFRVVAQNANANRTPVLYVNGINTDLGRATRTAAEISRLTGAPVDLTYNSSSVTVAVSKSLDHFENVARGQATAAVPKFLHGKPRQQWINIDTARRVAAYANGPQVAGWAKRNMLQNPPSAQTTANLIAEQLDKTNDAVNVVAYSQGGAITVEALNLLRAQGIDVSPACACWQLRRRQRAGSFRQTSVTADMLIKQTR